MSVSVIFVRALTTECFTNCPRREVLTSAVRQEPCWSKSRPRYLSQGTVAAALPADATLCLLMSKSTLSPKSAHRASVNSQRASVNSDGSIETDGNACLDPDVREVSWRMFWLKLHPLMRSLSQSFVLLRKNCFLSRARNPYLSC